jgi:hypothetical protein
VTFDDPQEAAAPQPAEPPTKSRVGLVIAIAAVVVGALLLAGALVANSRAGHDLAKARSRRSAAQTAHGDAGSREHASEGVLKTTRDAATQQAGAIATKVKLAEDVLAKARVAVDGQIALAAISRDGSRAWEHGDVSTYNADADRFNSTNDAVNEALRALEDAEARYSQASSGELS